MNAKSNQINQLENNHKRRVLFIITQSELGGAQRFLSQLVDHLEPNVFEIGVASGPDGHHELKNILPSNVQYIAAKHLRRSPDIFNDLASIFELKKIIKEFRPDVLFLNSTKAGLAGSLAAHLLRIKKPEKANGPRDFTSYELKTIYRIGGWAFNDPHPWWLRYGIRWGEKISAPWKDYIIVNNKHDYDQAINLGIKPRKEVILIHNGIDPYKLDFLEKNEAKIRLYEKLPTSQKHASFLHDGLTIGTVANFYPTKGLQYLIEAFRILTYNLKPITYNLVIIGDGPERENLKSQISNLKLENRVFLAGRIPGAYKYLKAFDIFVLPSVKEGFPWALLEAMSAKLPIIATTVGANPEIIENEKNGLLVPPRNPQAIANAITKLALDEPHTKWDRAAGPRDFVRGESLRRELGIQAHQTVLHKFDINKMVDQVVAML